MSKMTIRKMLAVLSGAMIIAGAAAPATVLAQTGADKATVDAGKAQGQVGEQADGYLGVVSGSNPSLAAAVAAINQGRAQVYASIAAKTGVSPADAAAATGQKLIDKLPPGQFYKPVGGGWTRK
jgi:uncharacterized protein